MNRTLMKLTTIVISLALGSPAFAELEQTPIDINRANTVHDPSPPSIEFYYGTVNVKLTNTYGAKDETNPGRVIAQEWATLKATPQNVVPYILVDGVKYNLLQFHFHTPSEHAIKGDRTPMEVHFVHIRDDGGCGAGPRPLVVLGAFIKEGAANKELQRLFPDGLPKINTDAAVDVPSVNLDALLPHGKPEWRYEGSLTAPSNACSGFEPLSTQLVTGEFPEAVHWFVYDESLHLPKGLIERFRELFPEGNARNLKEIGARSVYARDNHDDHDDKE